MCFQGKNYEMDSKEGAGLLKALSIIYNHLKYFIFFFQKNDSDITAVFFCLQNLKKESYK